jgi:hypothetical protein
MVGDVIGIQSICVEGDDDTYELVGFDRESSGGNGNVELGSNKNNQIQRQKKCFLLDFTSIIIQKT